ncbi:hypothetical protein FZC74_06820 [Sutcliffiella horikoshii]|uniref:DegT/DnrJ/EryC1/StrS aminotransferase family protein n=1 Tax=Sutcliffiella horikoshii TaxID=79883 RepID=A0AA94WRG2_9BACI|nr:hypothetical protein [Sutcliffiella horikoshii]TYS59862.1 hypothetical protein FZC74_06820 [Sutcliffiella horikoshii]
MKEIGSEFWLEDNSIKNNVSDHNSFFNIGSDKQFLLSGRTAIDYVLKDILKNNKVNTVYFPSYCCQSMLQPFIDLGINIIFYHVCFEKGLKFNINVNQECDLFFAMNYFGFTKGRMDKYIEIFKQRNIIVIEDSTHSLLSSKSYNPQSDYIVASLRKWFPILSGGLAVKTRKQFEINPKNSTLDDMIRIRKSAMVEKNKYINIDSYTEKQVFLDKYTIANELLNEDYALYNIDKESYEILQNLNIETIVSKRKGNARRLYESLPNNDRFQLLFSKLEGEDCPIFIPIIFYSNTERNSLRRHLQNNNVYCPVHWPNPTILKEQNTPNIFDYELSLVADQRYEDTDMQYLIRRLVEFYE